MNVDAFDHALVKGLRDLLVIGVGAALTALASNATGFGVPSGLAPFVGAASLYLYRLLREHKLLAAVGIDPKGGV